MDGARALSVEDEQPKLLDAAAAGDAAAFDALVQQHAQRVFRLAFAMLGSREDAEDVQQETFVRAFRRLSTFRGDSSFGAWICSIAARLCLTRRRRARRAEGFTCQLPDHLLSSTGDPHQRLLEREAAARVQQALADLSPPDRLLIVLKCIEGLSHDEISRILRCSPGSSRSRLSRAKKLFRQRYERTQ